MTGSRISEALTSSDRAEFLARWMEALCISSRANTTGDEDESVRLRRTLAINEVVLVLATQLASELGGGPLAYPDEALLDVLKDKADAGQCAGEVLWATREALRRVDLSRRRRQ